MLTRDRLPVPAGLLPAPAPLPSLTTAFSRRAAIFGAVLTPMALANHRWRRRSATPRCPRCPGATPNLAKWIEGRPGDLIAPSHIQRLAPNALRMNAAKTRERIRALCEAGRLEAVGEADIDGKHYREAYRINRLGKH